MAFKMQHLQCNRAESHLMASTSQGLAPKDKHTLQPYGNATSKRSKRFHVSRTASSPMAYKTEDTLVEQGASHSTSKTIPRLSHLRSDLTRSLDRAGSSHIPSTDEQHQEQLHAIPPFQWSKHWYPVSVEDCLDKDKPNRVTLLGRDYVVWDDNGLWNVARDECPHRFVPLDSEFQKTLTIIQFLESAFTRFTYRA